MEKFNILLLTLLLLTNVIVLSFIFKFSSDLDSIRTATWETKEWMTKIE